MIGHDDCAAQLSNQQPLRCAPYSPNSCVTRPLSPSGIERVLASSATSAYFTPRHAAIIAKRDRAGTGEQCGERELRSAQRCGGGRWLRTGLQFCDSLKFTHGAHPLRWLSNFTLAGCYRDAFGTNATAEGGLSNA